VLQKQCRGSAVTALALESTMRFRAVRTMWGRGSLWVLPEPVTETYDDTTPGRVWDDVADQPDQRVESVPIPAFGLAHESTASPPGPPWIPARCRLHPRSAWSTIPAPSGPLSRVTFRQAYPLHRGGACQQQGAARRSVSVYEYRKPVPVPRMARHDGLASRNSHHVTAAPAQRLALNDRSPGVGDSEAPVATRRRRRVLRRNARLFFGPSSHTILFSPGANSETAHL
jgi:hypothetical protein